MASGTEVESIEYFKILKVMLSGHAATSTILISAFLISSHLELAAQLAQIFSSRSLITANSQKRAFILMLKNRVSVWDSAIVTIEH